MSMGTLDIPVSGEDVDILARTVFGEARGETLQGQIAVAWVIVHRAQLARAWKKKHGTAHRFYGDGSIAAACKAAKQFSCWNAGSPTLKAMESATLDMPAFRAATYVALGVTQRALSDALPASTHYYAPKGVIKTPVWVSGRAAQGGKPALKPARHDGTIGGHRFYSEVG